MIVSDVPGAAAEPSLQCFSIQSRSSTVDEKLVRKYFAGHPLAAANARVLEWRTYCFREGLSYVDYLERNFRPAAGARVLDLACGWGGHALAFASRGASVVASDMSDYDFSRLSAFAASKGLQLETACGDCQHLPYDAESFDVILALHVIEHIPDPKRFAEEIVRLLRPGGVCFFATPSRLRSVFNGEPHYGLKYLALLPFKMQHLVACKVFKRKYPYPIVAQYSTVRSILKLFRTSIKGRPEMGGGRLEQLLLPYRALLGLAAEVYWCFIVLYKPH